MTADEIMALADKHAAEHREAALSRSGKFMEYNALVANALDARSALRAAVEELVRDANRWNGIPN